MLKKMKGEIAKGVRNCTHLIAPKVCVFIVVLVKVTAVKTNFPRCSSRIWPKVRLLVHNAVLEQIMTDNCLNSVYHWLRAEPQAASRSQGESPRWHGHRPFSIC